MAHILARAQYGGVAVAELQRVYYPAEVAGAVRDAARVSFQLAMSHPQPALNVRHSVGHRVNHAHVIHM